MVFVCDLVNCVSNTANYQLSTPLHSQLKETERRSQLKTNLLFLFYSSNDSEQNIM